MRKIWIILGCGLLMSTAAARADAPALPVETLNEVLGTTGTVEGDEYKISVPQDRLDVTVDGFRIIPPMGATSWVTFTPIDHGARVMGDLVVLAGEIGPLQQILIDNGLSVTGLHNHFLRDEPKLMFMHIGGQGTPLALAEAVRDVLDRVDAIREAGGLASRARAVETTFDPQVIAEIVGHEGTTTEGVYKITVARPEVDLRTHGVEVTPFAGFTTWMAFQGAPENAAVAGDFAMLAHEVGHVVEALVRSGIEVVALHNHMVEEEPRIFFLHFWGTGAVESLASGLRSALDAQAVARNEVD